MTKIYDTAELGALIKSKRAKLEITQSQLADVSGSGTRFISELENGKQTIQIGKAIETLHMLGLDLYISERGS